MKNGLEDILVFQNIEYHKNYSQKYVYLHIIVVLHKIMCIWFLAKFL